MSGFTPPSDSAAGGGPVGTISRDELFRLLVESVRDYAVYALDPQGHVISWNEGARRLKGYEEEEILGKDFSRFFPPEDIARGKPEMELREAARLGRYEDEDWRVRKDGTRFWANVVITALRDSGGRLVGYAKVTRDLTERKRAEERVRFEARLLDAVEHALVATDPEGRIVYWNPEAQKLYGWKSAEVRGRNILDVTMAPEQRQKATEVMERLKRRKSWSGEFLVKHKDGSIFPAMVTDSPVIDERGDLLGYVGVSTDLRERKRVEHALREEAQLVETLQHIGGTLAAELEPDTLAQTVIDAGTTLTGAEFGAFFYEVEGEGGAEPVHAFSGAVPEGFRRLESPREAEVFAPTFAGEEVVRLADATQDARYAGKLPAELPEGSAPVRSYLAVPVVSRSGETVGGLVFGHVEAGIFDERDERVVVGLAGWAAVAMDNARLYQAERQARSEAEAASRAKSDFLAVMSHELRTPLGAVLGYAELLEMGIPGPLNEAQHQQLRRLQASAKHLLLLIEEVLTFSRAEAGKEVLRLGSADARELAQEVASTIEPLAGDQGLRFEVRLPDAPLPMRTDTAKVKQILMNLLSNAVKFTEEGEVRLELERRGKHARFRVSDTGIGIDPENLEQIFEPFWQVEQGSTRTAGGTGLGLSVVRRLAEMLGGKASASSEKGGGSTFEVTLPLETTAPASAKPA